MIHYDLRSDMPRRRESALADEYALTMREIRFTDSDIERSKRFVKNIKADMTETARHLQILQQDLRNLTSSESMSSSKYKIIQNLVIIPQIRAVEAEITNQEAHYNALLDRALFITNQHQWLMERRKELFDSLGYQASS